MKWPKSFFSACAVVASLCYGQLPAFSAAYPVRPVELAIVFSPGGALDVAARALAKEAETMLGQAFIPTNTPGGAGVPGITMLSKAAPDGYHLAAAVSNALIFLPHRQETPYRPLADLEPVFSFGQAAPVLITGSSAPWTGLDAFLTATRAKNGEMRVGVPGLGSPSHIVLSMIRKQDPLLNWRFIPFEGPGEAEAALLGGHVDAAVSGALPRIKDGQFQPLMVLASDRLVGLPDVPALADKGFSDPGKGDAAFLLLAPAGTPEAVLNTLEAAFLKAADSDAFRKAVAGFSVTPVLRDRAATKAFLREAWNEETSILSALGLTDKAATQPE